MDLGFWLRGVKMDIKSLPAGEYYIGDLCYVMHKHWWDFFTFLKIYLAKCFLSCIMISMSK